MQKYRDLIQNLAIALLSLSAVALFTQTQLYNLDLLGTQEQTAASQVVSAAPADLTAPVRVAVTGDYGRYGSVSLTTGDDEFTDPLGRRLLEALGSAGEYSACTEMDFLRALKRPSLYYDFLEPLPLSVLAGLLGGGEEVSEDLSARRLLITPQTGGALLYLWDGGESCYRAVTAVSADSLSQDIGRYELGGASFAMDAAAGSPERELAPCSLLPAELPTLPAFTVGDPLAASADWLLAALGFNPLSRTRHTESNGTELIMDGDRTLRIRSDNSVYYQSGRDPSLTVASAGELPTLREAALGAGTLLTELLSPVSGEARLWLQSVRQSGDVTALRFGYQAGGVPIRFQDRGYAAELTLTGSAVTSLTLRLRLYEASEEPSLLLPLPQALAVAAESPGEELSVGYVERNGECRACWLQD